MMRFCLVVATVMLLGTLGAQTAPLDGSGEKQLVLKGGTVYPITSAPIEKGVVVIQRGKIAFLGHADEMKWSADATVVDVTGKHIMPGIIDAHSHMGVYSWPGVDANSDGNELTAPVTAQVRSEDSINLQDPAFERARAGGVTEALILPGSGNIIGGQAVVIKLRPDSMLSAMKMAEAPRQLKMAMGENPKRVYGERGQLPSTRMGTMAKLREVFTKAQEYKLKLVKFDKDTAAFKDKKAAWDKKSAEAKSGGKEFDEDEPMPPEPVEQDALSQELADVMDGKVRVQVHCYRTDDIQGIIRISDEFGFKIASLHHILEGYKVAPMLAERGIGACTWPDWWGFKMEAFDATPYGAAIMMKAGVTVAFKSDSSDTVQRLYHEAAKGVKYGLTQEQALAAITINPAKILGIDKWVGSIEPGKEADIAIFSKSPLDMYTRVDKTLIDGREVYDRATTESKQKFTEAAR